MSEQETDSNIDTGIKQVPEDLAKAGHDTTIPQADSPESLDQEIAEGANREDIDPQHSIDRPAIDNIDEETNGAD